MKALLSLFAFPLLAQQGVDVYSLEKEQALGRHLAAEVRQQSKPLDNADVNAYVKRIGEHLAAKLTEAPFEFHFEAIVSDASEPVPVPGGTVFVPAAFFTLARDEDEFATMLAHSMAHIALRHGTRSAARGQMLNHTIPIVFMGGWMGPHATSQSRSVLMPAGFLSFQRTFELEADKFGVELASRAEYQPRAFRNYIERMQVADSNLDLSPLPQRELRLVNLDELLRQLPDRPPSSNEEYLRSQAAVREILKKPADRVPRLRR